MPRSPVWFITVDHWLKSKQQGSMAAQMAPSRKYGCLLLFGSMAMCMRSKSAGRQWSVVQGCMKQ